MQNYNDIGLEDMAHIAATHDASSTPKKKNNASVHKETKISDVAKDSTEPILDNGLEEMAYIAAHAEDAPKRKPSVASKIKDYIESVVHGKDDTHTR